MSCRRTRKRRSSGTAWRPNRKSRRPNAILDCVIRPAAAWNKTPQEAVKWFIRAARQGDKTAQHNLGVHYATLEETEQAAERCRRRSRPMKRNDRAADRVARLLVLSPAVSDKTFAPMFELLKTDTPTKARLGRLTTAHGVVDTPVFMPVGTQGSVKALDPRELREMGTQIILGNTYHLNIRPGLDIIRAAGGLHRFMNWDAADPDRQRRLPGVQPGEDPQDQGARRRVPLAPGRLAAVSRAEGSDGHPARARLGHRDGVRRLPAAHQHAARVARRGRAHHALGGGMPRTAARAGPDWSSASCRAAPTRRCARNAPRRWWRWSSTATPSAA